MTLRTSIIAIEWTPHWDSQKYRSPFGGWHPVYCLRFDAMICLYSREGDERPRGVD